MMATSSSVPRRPGIARAGVLPAIGGVAAAAASASGALLLGSWAGLPAVIMVCAAIYVLAAAVGRRGAAWIGFAVSLAVVAPGVVLGNPWISLAVLAAFQVVLVVVGLVRGAWREPLDLVQLGGAVVFGALAVFAAAGAAPWAGIVAVVALLGHGAWDLWHHRVDAVVTRPYAVFCAVYDLALAVAVSATLVLVGVG